MGDGGKHDAPKRLRCKTQQDSQGGGPDPAVDDSRRCNYVITITSPRNVTKITSQNFFQFRPLPIKIFGYASGYGLII